MARRRPRRRSMTSLMLEDIVSEAECEGLSYGQYVARKDKHVYASALKLNSPSMRVHPRRTLIEGLEAEGIKSEEH